jgi:MFS family permease
VRKPDQDAVYRKIALRLMPFLLACYVIAQIDRFNISFAKLQFLGDLRLNDAIFGFAGSFFYVGFMAFEVPSNLLLARVGVRKILSSLMVGWGAVTCLLMFARNDLDLYVLRFLLGATQAGFLPGVIFYLTLWFPDRLRGRANALLITGIPMAGIVGGPLAGWIMENMQGLHDLRGWQWLFLLEGIPAILLGMTAYVFLDNDPASSAWLSASEKRAMLNERGAGQARLGVKNSETLWAVVRDFKIWQLGLIYFGYFCSLNAVVLWSPTVLAMVSEKSVGLVGWLSGLVAILSTIGMIAIGLSSDHFKERYWHVGVCGLIAAGCLLLLPLAAKSVGLTMVLLILAATGVYTVLGLFWTIPGAYLESKAAAGGIALISTFGAFGGVVSPALIGWLKVKTESLYVGLSTVAVLLVVSMVALILSGPSAGARA